MTTLADIRREADAGTPVVAAYDPSFSPRSTCYAFATVNGNRTVFLLAGVNPTNENARVLGHVTTVQEDGQPIRNYVFIGSEVNDATAPRDKFKAFTNYHDAFFLLLGLHQARQRFC